MSRATEYTADLSCTIRDLELYLNDVQSAVKRARSQLNGLQHIERSLDHQARQLANLGSDRRDATTQFSESMIYEELSDSDDDDSDTTDSGQRNASTQISESMIYEEISGSDDDDSDSDSATPDIDLVEVDVDREVQECLRASMAPIQDRPPTPWPSTNVSDVDEDDDYRRMTLKMELDGAFEGLDD